MQAVVCTVYPTSQPFAYVCHCAVPQVDQPVGCLLDDDVVVPLVGRAWVVVVAEVAQPGALEVPVAAARLSALLGGNSIGSGHFLGHFSCGFFSIELKTKLQR